MIVEKAAPQKTIVEEVALQKMIVERQHRRRQLLRKQYRNGIWRWQHYISELLRRCHGKNRLLRHYYWVHKGLQTQLRISNDVLVQQIDPNGVIEHFGGCLLCCLSHLFEMPFSN
jgi:hypothetical protein